MGFCFGTDCTKNCSCSACTTYAGGPQIQQAIAVARVPDVPEIREAFD